MTVLVTGANRGIGAGLVRHFAAQDKRVIGTARQPGPDSPLLPLDVTDPASVNALATTLDGQPLDTLVCNAGVYLDKGQNLADGYAPALWADTFAANVTGVFLTVQALLPNLQMHDSAKVAIISSNMGSSTNAGGSSYIYRASKAAALNLGRNLALDLKGLGIAVGVYHPGWVQTDMGGATADLTMDDAIPGLAARIEALSLANTGCFERYDGEALPF